MKHPTASIVLTRTIHNFLSADHESRLFLINNFPRTNQLKYLAYDRLISRTFILQSRQVFRQVAMGNRRSGENVPTTGPFSSCPEFSDIRMPSSIDSYVIANSSLARNHVSIVTLGIAIALPISTTICHIAFVVFSIIEVFGILFTGASGFAGVEKKNFFVQLPVAMAISEVKLT